MAGGMTAVGSNLNNYNAYPVPILRFSAFCLNFGDAFPSDVPTADI